MCAMLIIHSCYQSLQDFDRILDEDVTDSGQFSYLPPGVVQERTVDNETGRLV